MINSWLPRRYPDVIRAQAREVDRILSAWVRGQALCCLTAGAVLYRGLTAGGAGSGASRRADGGAAVVHSLCRFDHRRGNRDRTGAGAVPPLARRDRGRRCAGCRPDIGRLRDLSALPGRPRRATRGVGDFRAVRRRRGVRLSGRDAGGAGAATIGVLAASGCDAIWPALSTLTHLTGRPGVPILSHEERMASGNGPGARSADGGVDWTVQPVTQGCVREVDGFQPLLGRPVTAVGIRMVAFG